jgi:NTP pyrophosphatase (non-canonical NTP hydrolase)
MQDIQEEIVDWIGRIHPNRTTEGTLVKLFEEIGELASKPSDVDEYADVLIVLLDIAHQQGISASDLLPAVRRKMEVNRNRTWMANDLGVMTHV